MNSIVMLHCDPIDPNDSVFHLRRVGSLSPSAQSYWIKLINIRAYHIPAFVGGRDARVPRLNRPRRRRRDACATPTRSSP